MQSQRYEAHIRTRRSLVVQESLKESKISNYESCYCLVGVLMNLSSGSALIIDNQLNDDVYATVIRKRQIIQRQRA